MGLKIIVCVKAVILDPPKESVPRSQDVCEMNPFDRPALDVAFHLKDKHGGVVTALSMGPDTCTFVLQESIAMGADQGVLVSDPALAGSDTLATSTALGAALEKLAPFDLILFGSRSADSDTGHVGPQTAVLLDIPFIGGAYSIEGHEKVFMVRRRMDELDECFELSLPGALTIHQTTPQSPDIGLVDIENAFEGGELITWNLTDIGLSPEQVGDSGSPSRVISFSRVGRERHVEILGGTDEEQAEDLLKRLLDAGLIG